MRIGSNFVPIVVAGQQITDPTCVTRILEKFSKEFAQGGDFCSRPHQSQLGAAVHDDALGGRTAFGRVGVEQRGIGTVGHHRCHLPAEVHRVLQTKVQTRPTERRMDMRRIANQENRARSVPRRDPRIDAVEAAQVKGSVGRHRPQRDVDPEHPLHAGLDLRQAHRRVVFVVVVGVFVSRVIEFERDQH